MRVGKALPALPGDPTAPVPDCPVNLPAPLPTSSRLHLTQVARDQAFPYTRSPALRAEQGSANGGFVWPPCRKRGVARKRCEQQHGH